MDNTLVILVNEYDEVIGHMEKIQAHQEAKLHRAFSIIIFNSKNEMLLQQRAIEKYHSGGLWTNACCSHPYYNEDTESACHRRLKEEIGFDTNLEKAFSFTYHAPFENGLTEHEYDHVYIGKYEDEIKINLEEVMAVEYKSMEEIKNEIKNAPEKYTVWFRIIFAKLTEWLLSNKIAL
jgi:isopentenyl-diphosphate delta-isomerase